MENKDGKVGRKIRMEIAVGLDVEVVDERPAVEIGDEVVEVLRLRKWGGRWCVKVVPQVVIGMPEVAW